jgi:hypothetical protein
MSDDTLFDIPVDRLLKEFEEYHLRHPEVYYHLVRLAREWKTAGRAKLGIATLYERLRWEFHLTNHEDDKGYKLSNNHRALYARKIMEHNPDLEGLFELRERTSVEVI